MPFSYTVAFVIFKCDIYLKGITEHDYLILELEMICTCINIIFFNRFSNRIDLRSVSLAFILFVTPFGFLNDFGFFILSIFIALSFEALFGICNPSILSY